MLFTKTFYLRDDLFYYVFVIIFKTERCFNWHTTANIKRIQLGTDLLQIGIYVQAFGQLGPVINRIFNAGVYEKMQYFQFQFRIVLDLFLIKINYLFIADAQARSIELE